MCKDGRAVLRGALYPHRKGFKMIIRKKDANALLYLVDVLKRGGIERPENAADFCKAAAGFNEVARDKNLLAYKPARYVSEYANLVITYCTRFGLTANPSAWKVDLFAFAETGELFITEKLQAFLNAAPGAQTMTGARLIIRDKKAEFLPFYQVKKETKK